MLDRIALITGNAGKAAEYAVLGIDAPPPAAKAELTEVSPSTSPSSPPHTGKPAVQRAEAGKSTLSSAVNVKPAHDVRAPGP